MTIAALITEGIGPGSAVKFILTGGLDIGAKPPGPAVIPHDDYDYEPWYRRRNDYTSRLDAMRREIGIIPKEAQRAVAKAATVILAKPQAARTEAKAFDLVKHYEAAFRRAMRVILGRLRAEDIEAAWKEQVRRSLVERAEEEELILIAQWLL